MRHPIAKTIVATAGGIVLLAGVSAAAVPAVRHIASAWWNSPDGLPALPGNPQVHYEEGASDYARAVAGLLPTAIARVEAVHGLFQLRHAVFQIGGLTVEGHPEKKPS